MEERKRKEIEYYDAGAKHFSGSLALVLGSHRFLYKVAASLVAGKKVLDYGCGNGVHSGFLAEHASQVVGIDLSEASLEVARKVHDTRRDKVSFIKMDCEALEFPDQSFDVVLDGGTFSSLDFQKALAEITRVLKPNGQLVGIETFGHNPIANAKRALNRLTGKRTAWAASHIVTQKEIEALRQHFKEVEMYYFHLISLFAFPLLSLPGGYFVLRLLEGIDRALLHFPFFQTYAFKVVFVCRKGSSYLDTNISYGKEND